MLYGVKIIIKWVLYRMLGTATERINKEENFNTGLEPSNLWLTSCIYFALLS